MHGGAGTQGGEAQDALDCLNEGVRLESWVITRLKATALERASPRAGELKGGGGLEWHRCWLPWRCWEEGHPSVTDSSKV